MKKKVLAVILGAAMVASMAGCGGSNAKTTDTAESTETTDSTDDAESTDATEATDGESYTIGISQFAEHGSLDNCREGFLEGLKEEGIEEGKNLTVKVNNADADMGTASQIAQSFVTDNVDLICAIATPSAQAAYNAAMEKGIPVVYTAVTNPVEAELATEDKMPVGAVTGTSDQLPVEAQLKMIREILPEVLVAGEDAGVLTEEGAKLLDPTGTLQSGIPMCPPEGDAGTGMVATNAVKQRTGNVSAGTSSFSMIVLEKELSKPYEMIDMVTTPDGSLVAMVHCNNCTSDLNAWVNLFKEYQELLGIPVNMDEIYSKLYNIALTGDTDCGGLLSYNYISGEPVTGLADGRPLFVRSANDKFNLANFMRTHLYASVGVLKIGNDILFNEEKIKVDRITGHGGLFKTKGVGQRILAAAINSPISVMETAGEGGAWGIALLGSYLVNNEKKQSLADFLEDKVFAGDAGIDCLLKKQRPNLRSESNRFKKEPLYMLWFTHKELSLQILNKIARINRLTNSIQIIILF